MICNSYYIDGIVYACTCGKCVDSNTPLKKKSVGKKAGIEAMKAIDEYTNHRNKRYKKVMATTTANELMRILQEFELYRQDNPEVSDTVEELFEFLTTNKI